MSVDSVGLLVDDTSIASHFAGFRVNLFSIVKLLTVSICSSRATDTSCVSMDEFSSKSITNNGPSPLLL